KGSEVKTVDTDSNGLLVIPHPDRLDSIYLAPCSLQSMWKYHYKILKTSIQSNRINVYVHSDAWQMARSPRWFPDEKYLLVHTYKMHKIPAHADDKYISRLYKHDRGLAYSTDFNGTLNFKV